MENILENIQAIRELCNHPWKSELLLQDRIRWNKLWTCLDTITDTQLAIESYEELPEFNSYSGGYLFIYGVMQALNIQQDALNNLSIALFNKGINFEKDFPDLYTIREHRNNAIGHPTKRGNDRSFHEISRSSINKNGFELSSYYPNDQDGSKYESIKVVECIQTQRHLAHEILLNVKKKLQSEFNAHKKKFKGQKLSTLIYNDFHYEFSKLHTGVERDYPLTEFNFKIIFDAYEKIKQGIIDRYFSLEGLQGIKYITSLLDYLFGRLQRDLVEEKINDKMELGIFVNSLITYFKEFQEMVKEIDKEFS